MRVRVTDAPVLSLAGPVLAKTSDEGSKVREMPGRDLHGGGQMLQAVHLDGPRRVIPEDLSNPSLLGTGEHGAAIVTERAAMGQGDYLTLLTNRLTHRGALALTLGRIRR
jgi:hypothetical protein